MPDNGHDAVKRLQVDLGEARGGIEEITAVFAALVEHSPIPLWIYNSQLYVVYNNRAAVRFGSGDDCVGSHYKAFSVQLRERLGVGLARCRDSQQPYDSEDWMQSDVLGHCYLRFRFLPLPLGLVASTVQDLTADKRIEEALSASEERATYLGEILERATLPFAMTNNEGRLVMANAAFCNLTGYSEEQLQHISLFRELTTPAFAEAERWALNLLRKSGRPQRYEKRIPRQDGSELPVEVFLQQVGSTQGGLKQCIAFVTDISDRKQVEEALRQSEERFRLVTELATDGIWDWYIGSNEEYLSPRLKEMLGYSDDELPNLEHTWEQLIHPDDLPIAQEAYNNHMAHGQPFSYIARYLHKDGSIVWVQCRGEALKDSKGQYYRMVGTHTNVTGLKQVEESLRRSEERVLLALQGAADGIWDYDLSTETIYRSPFMMQWLGYGDEGMAPTVQSWLDLVHPDDLDQVIQAWKAHLGGQTEQYVSEHRLRTASGEYMWVLDSGKVVERDAAGKPLRVAGTHKDVTERRRFQERLLQEQKEQSITALAGGIAHDFNNILTGVLGTASLLAEALPQNDPAVELCNIIVRAAQRMADLTSKLQAFARGGSYKLQVVDVVQALLETLALVRASIPPQVELQTELPDEVWPVLADPGQLDQVLINLIVNAREAIGDRPGTIRIQLRNSEFGLPWQDLAGQKVPAGKYVGVIVRDSGCGIAPEQLKQLFEPYFSTKGRGRGLGLAAVSGILKQHGGAITVQSTAGKGSIFAVYLPRAEAAVEHPAAAGEEQFSGKGRVLLMDDDDEVLDVIGAMLRQLGYEVLVARSVEQCLERLGQESETLALAVFDLRLRQLDALQLLGMLRDKCPKLPVLLCSGFSQDLALGSSNMDPYTRYLQKPFDLLQLGRCVRELLDTVRRGPLLDRHWSERLQV